MPVKESMRASFNGNLGLLNRPSERAPPFNGLEGCLQEELCDKAALGRNPLNLSRLRGFLQETLRSKSLQPY